MARRRTSKHRYLFNKPALIRQATAAVVIAPADPKPRAYLRGLCDACHGTSDEPTAHAIHVARQVILATGDQ